MKEPSVLDYLKSRLKFWEREGKVEIPAEEEKPKRRIRRVTIAPAVEVKPARGGRAAVTLPEPEKPSRRGRKVITPPEPVGKPEPFSFAGLPWRSLLAVIFTLLGERAFEPTPQRATVAGLVFYGIGLVWFGLAYWRKEWRLTSLPEPEEGLETFKVRAVPLILGTLLAAVAFIDFGGNLFTRLNTTLWVLAIVCYFWAFWLPDARRRSLWSRFKDFFGRASWQVNISRWSLLVLAVIGLVIFFRVYRLSGVPGEPFSDHAEKILDVFDVTRGQTHIFFPRNTGREADQMYLSAAVAWLFGTGLTFLTLKIGTAIAGLAMLPYLYLLGKEFGSRRVGLLAVLFCGIAYWPNVISRVGLRFPLYPLFVAPMLYYLIRGLRRRNRNDFILSGLFLGLGLHGYSPYRIVPFIVVIAIGLYLVHAQSKGVRRNAVIWLAIVTLISIVVFLPLGRYALENPEMFDMRAMSRLGNAETPLPGPAWQIFLSNTWNVIRMTSWDNGEIWVHSVPHRPAMDVVSAALLIVGAVLVFIRYVRSRHWQDLFLLLSVPLLELPSILSLAFPSENPSLNRTAGAVVPVFLIVALALDGLLAGISSRMNRRSAAVLTWIVILVLVGGSCLQNYDLVFHQYDQQFLAGAWNTNEMGMVIKDFDQLYGTPQNAWIVPFPYWVDTRLPAIYIGVPDGDFALWPADFNKTLDLQGPKLFIVKPEDTADVDALRSLYPQGTVSTYYSALKNAGKDFLIFFVPPAQ